MDWERARRVYDLTSAGVPPWRAGPLAGVSTEWARRLHRRVGGVYRPTGTRYCDRYLDRDERYELRRLLDAGYSQAEIGRRMRRHPSTIGRELRRNRAPRTGEYQPERANRLAFVRQRRPKPSWLSQHPQLAAVVQDMLDRRRSPEQIAGRLAALHPDNPEMRISHESIYKSIYIYPRGELKRELKACLRRGRAVRRPRGQRDRRSSIPNPVSIHDRPEEVEGRLIPGHHEGDLLMGSKASNSAVGTIVERTTGYLTLLPLREGYRAEQVADAIVEHMSVLPAWFAKTLTWDRGLELARHATVTTRTGIDVYFADPYSPYQRGSNENTNGLLREYLPKGTDLSIYTDAELAFIAGELNDRPRKRLGYLTPHEALTKLREQELQRVATTA
jgi:IS30 family transposase